jgi:hypothetical protein
MLTRDQMKIIVGGYGPCMGYGTDCTSGGGNCCGIMTCGYDNFYGPNVCR